MMRLLAAAVAAVGRPEAAATAEPVPPGLKAWVTARLDHRKRSKRLRDGYQHLQTISRKLTGGRRHP